MPAPFYEAKKTAFRWIEENADWLSEFDLEIWRYAEPAWREYKSARAYVELLRRHGFDVDVGSGGCPQHSLPVGARGDRCSVLTQSMMPCLEILRSPFRIGSRVKGCTPGQRDILIHTRCSAWQH